MSDTDQTKAEGIGFSASGRGANPLVAVSVAIGVALIMVTFTFNSFLKSNAYSTIKEIQANNANGGSRIGDYDTTSPVKAIDIEETSKDIENRINSLDNSADYGPEQVTNDALGL